MHPTFRDKHGTHTQNLVQEHLGHHDGDVPHVHEGQLNDEEVHGGVKLGIGMYQEDQDSISRQRHQENQEDDNTKWRWVL